MDMSVHKEVSKISPLLYRTLRGKEYAGIDKEIQEILKVTKTTIDGESYNKV